MKRLDNPPNPYESACHEWLEPPPAVEVAVYEERARSILSENDSPDVGYRWSVNPYRGCQHACTYCYARRTHEYLGFGAGSDFDSRIVVKTNAAKLLARELRARSWQGELIAFSGVTDCYQPLEAVYGLTRACLEVCLKHRNPVGVVTKSYLVVRDTDLIRDLASVTSARVMFSIPFRDAKDSRLIEPGAPTPERRFEAMRRMADAGVPVGIMIAPIIPGLNDRDIPDLLSRAADCGARAAGTIALRLPGSVEQVFLSRLRESMPLRYERIEHRIREIRGGELYDCRFGERMHGQGKYWEAIEQVFAVAARRYGLDEPFEVESRPAAAPGPPPVPARPPPKGDLPGAQLELPFA